MKEIYRLKRLAKLGKQKGVKGRENSMKFVDDVAWDFDISIEAFLEKK